MIASFLIVNNILCKYKYIDKFKSVYTTVKPDMSCIPYDISVWTFRMFNSAFYRYMIKSQQSHQNSH